MNAPPGCPLQRVTMISDPQNPAARGYGKVLKLACGHSLWEAGFPAELADVAFMTPIYRPCLSGCYQHQRAMGDQC